MLSPGDPAPQFAAASSVNPIFHFDTAAGRYLVLTFVDSFKAPFAARLLDEMNERPSQFNVTDAAFCGVTADPADRNLKGAHPGVILFFDPDRAVSRAYGAAPQPGGDGAPTPAGSGYRPQTLILDQALRVLAVMPHGDDPVRHVADVVQFLGTLPSLDALTAPAPILTIPYVFDTDFCRHLIDYYHANGGQDSGFMRDVNGKTTEIKDYSHKRRTDCNITDEPLIQAAQQRLARRVIPAIRQAFQFNVTRIERHIVACYDAAEGAHFRAHRDNTTLGTAHRRFAVTINLNAEEFDGGQLWFPEFSRRAYKATTGGAVVFSCSLLHEVTPVTRGKRYAFLPFLYDEAAAKVRDRNRQHIVNAPREGTAPIGAG